MNNSELLGLMVASWNNYKNFTKAGSDESSLMVNKALLLRNWIESSDGLRGVLLNFPSLPLYDIQRKILDCLMSRGDEACVVLVKAPTASGKTEAACLPFFNQLFTGNYSIAPRLNYTLPLKSLASVTQTRLTVYVLALRAFLSLQKRDDVNGVVEDTLTFLDKYIKHRSLPVALETGSLTHQGGYLYKSFINAATIDAVIYSYVAQRVPGGNENPRLNLPAGLIASSLMIMDEVQLLQDEHYYSPRVLREVIKQLVSVRVPTIVMTATMPKVLEDEMFQGLDDILIHLEETNPAKRGDVDVEVRRHESLEDLLSEDLLKEFKLNLNDGKHVLVIANTPERACKAYWRISKELGKEEVELIHGRLIHEDRERVERELEGRAKVIVATQVIEAGFDYDAALLISEVAPIDSLIQRIGRIARKPDSTGKAVIAGKLENAAPYVEDLINRTLDLISEDQHLLKESLRKLSAAEEAMNNVYKRDILEKLMNLSDDKLVRSKAYLGKLRLFSFPPEDLDFALRPELYVTLVVDGDPEGELNKLWYELRERGREGVEVRSFDEWIKLTSFMESRALNVSSWFACKILDAGYIMGRLEIRFLRDRQGSSLKVYLRDAVAWGDILPMGSYLIKREAYRSHEGLVLPEPLEGTKLSVKALRRSRRNERT